jgi:hypothetical protein
MTTCALHTQTVFSFREIPFSAQIPTAGAPIQEVLQIRDFATVKASKIASHTAARAV